MRLWVLASMAVALALGGCTTASAQEGREGAVRFMREVYASYQEDQPWPIDDQRLDAVWSPRMAALIRRDRELADGDLPYLDADPICQCQDFEDIQVLDARADWNADTRVVVTVRFVNGGEESTGYFLMLGNPVRGWLIDDVLNPDGPSLAENLTASNARIEAGGSARGRD